MKCAWVSVSGTERLISYELPYYGTNMKVVWDPNLSGFCYKY